MRRTIAVVVLFIVAGGVVWWLVRESAPGPAIVGPAAASRPDSAPASLPAIRKIGPGTFAKTRAAKTVASDSPDVAVIRGRCVDAGGGAALPGCTATLRGNGPAGWESPPPAVTGADGGFEIRFDPPPSFAFFLFVEAPGRARMLGRFSKLEAGTLTDVGDVPMSPGTVVRGRVVDEGGAPQPKISVILAGADPTPRGKMGPQSHFELVSKPDGSIVSDAPLPAGTYPIEVRPPFELVTPQAIDLAEGADQRILEVKVRASSDADAILGMVQDEFGAPIRDAAIDYSPRGYKGNTSWSTKSGEEGAFRIQWVNQEREKPVTIKASREGYDPPAAPVKAKWGTKGVVIVLRRGVAVQVIVRDGDENKRLERYGVRCFRPGNIRTQENSTRVREQGFHRDGIADLPRIGRGRHLLLVEPEGVEWKGHAFRDLEVTDSGAPPPPLEVTLWRAVKKTVRVRRKDGSPVLATGVDLLRRIDDQPLDESTSAVSPDFLVLQGERVAQRLDSGATGSDGTTELSAPPHEKLVLRVMGSGHAPAIKEVDFATAASIIDVVVTSGATLAGRITPPELIPQLDTRDFPDSPITNRQVTGVRLRNTDSLRKPPFLEYPVAPAHHALGLMPGQSAAPIEPDGTFRIDGVPGGKWEVRLRYADQGGAGSWTTGSHVIGSVELVEGEVREQTFDLDYLLKAELEGSVTLDGKPLETGTVSFEGRITQSDGTTARVSKPNRPLGARGSFAASLWPGEYRPIVQFLREGRPQIMHGASVIKASAGQRLTVDVALRSSVLELRVLASDGQTPVADLELHVRVPDTDWNRASKPTDVLGRAEIEGLPGLELPISVWPKRLATSEARMAEKGLARPDDGQVLVKTVRITPPLTKATIVLPASTGY